MQMMDDIIIMQEDVIEKFTFSMIFQYEKGALVYYDHLQKAKNVNVGINQ
jgi:hypothetical protein